MSRRSVAIVLCALLALGYGAVFLVALTGTFHWLALGQALDVGGLWGALAFGLALGILGSLLARASATTVVSAFALWFMLAVVEMITVHPLWGALMVVNAAIPLAVLWSDLRRDALG